MHYSVWLWVLFNAFVIAMLVVDLRVFHRKAHEVTVKEALLWSGFWILLALIFNAGILVFSGLDPALKFFTGYLLEKSLSVDNLFVFYLIFSYFGIAGRYQHKILFWGIVGALVMRAVFIFAGVALLHHFHGIIYVFGAFLIVSGYKLCVEKEKEVHPEKNWALRIFRRIFPVTDQVHSERFFIFENGKWMATPLFVVLIMIESTDLIFAVDSIPAVLAISKDPFIVYTSNVFAILGLRALYFALAGLIGMFQYLHYGLGAILIFVGAKMIMEDVWRMPIGIALGTVALILLVSILFSIIKTQRDDKTSPSHK